MYIVPEHKNRKEIPEYLIWKGMRARCSITCNSNETYKEKNITVCDRWNDFVLFYNDMGPRPTSKHSIDRIQNDGNYEPTNCKWSLQKEQCENRGSFNKVFIHNGVPKVLKAIALDEGIKYTTLYNRMFKYNLSLDEAIAKLKRNESHMINGSMFSLKQICENYGLSYSAVHTYMHRHKELSLKEVLSFYNVIIEDIVCSA